MKLLQYLRQVSQPIKAGAFLKESKVVTQQDLDNFSDLTGDHNPIHKKTPDNPNPVVHGAFLNSIVAGFMGTKLPGPGTVIISQHFTFLSKCYAEVPIEVSIELMDIRKIVKAKYECTQNGKILLQGEAKLMINKS